MSVNMGPGNSTTYNPRCLTRDFAPVFATSHLNKTNVQETLQAKSFAEFDVLVQGGVTPSTFTYHGGGHLGVGGELGVVCVLSFYLHFLLC
jgi:tyrosinase